MPDNFAVPFEAWRRANCVQECTLGKKETKTKHSHKVSVKTKHSHNASEGTKHSHNASVKTKHSHNASVKTKHFHDASDNADRGEAQLNQNVSDV